MYPWLWFWAPRFQFPFSGNVAQEIEPDVDWFFGSIKPDAGNAQIEKKAFSVASYGKQLGLLTEVLIEMAERNLPKAAESAGSLQELKRIRSEIEKLKGVEYDAELDEVAAKVEKILSLGGPRASALTARLQKPGR